MLGLIVFYIAQFAGSGAAMPFLPLWFQARGFSPFQLSILMAAPYFGRSLLGPLLAVWADRFQLRRTPIAMMAIGGCLTMLPLLVLQGFWTCLITFFIGSVLLNSAGPLGDVVALREAQEQGFAFGIPRGIGTAAYLLSNLIVGYILFRAGLKWVIIWVAASAALMGIAARFFLPVTSVDTAPNITLAPFEAIAEPLRQSGFVLVILATGCIQASHGFYYSFSTILWQRQGLGHWAGPLWACAGLGEVMFMWLLGPWRKRFGVERLLVLSGLATAVRWGAMSLAPPLAVVFVLQTLHALSFAASYLASLHLIERICPPQAMSAGLLLNAALSSGVLIGAVTVISGTLFTAFGAQAYIAMSMLSLVGAVLAARIANVTT